MKFVIDPLKLKISSSLVQSNKNVLIVGPTGAGKTSFALKLAEELGLQPVIISCGSTQDARISFIGSFSLENGTTKFVKAPFLKSIQTPNSLIILDELSRASDDAQNLLFPVLDFRASMTVEETGEVIHVDPSVRFISTANLGSEYSAINSIDKALFDRFITFLLPYMTEEELVGYINGMNNTKQGNEEEIKNLCSIYGFVNSMFEKNKMNTRLSPRTILNCLELVNDFSIKQIYETLISSSFGDDEYGKDDRLSVSQFLDAKGIV